MNNLLINEAKPVYKCISLQLENTAVCFDLEKNLSTDKQLLSVHVERKDKRASELTNERTNKPTYKRTNERTNERSSNIKMFVNERVFEIHKHVKSWFLAKYSSNSFF
jgi:hypothetical protein